VSSKKKRRCVGSFYRRRVGVEEKDEREAKTGPLEKFRRLRKSTEGLFQIER
jgi:hypothetical protein